MTCSAAGFLGIFGGSSLLLYMLVGHFGLGISSKLRVDVSFVCFCLLLCLVGACFFLFLLLIAKSNMESSSELLSSLALSMSSLSWLMANSSSSVSYSGSLLIGVWYSNSHSLLIGVCCGEGRFVIPLLGVDVLVVALSLLGVWAGELLGVDCTSSVPRGVAFSSGGSVSLSSQHGGRLKRSKLSSVNMCTIILKQKEWFWLGIGSYLPG